MILGRSVNPRATRMALMQASVPELTMRTFSTLGTHSFNSCAMRNSCGWGMPKLVPCSAAFFTASMIAGLAWPKIAGPQVPT